jgi:hypothetical protein
MRMVSLHARYLAGEHEAVWAEINRGWAGYGETYAAEVQRHYTIDRTDAEAVAVETFARVARNADRVIERLRETGYRFECESGRDEPERPPRRPADLTDVTSFLEDTFGDHSLYDAQLSPLPPALSAFANIVGTLDLRQRYPYSPAPMLPDGSLNPEAFPSGLTQPELSDERRKLLSDAADLLQSVLPPPDPQDLSRRAAIAEEDKRAHPQSGDPILSRLGDWDPLEVNFDLLTYTLTDTEAEPQIAGGLIWSAEFAASFEHKAHVSGATNPWIAFPQASFDPEIQTEGHDTTFTTYLRRAFRNGGFLGIPRPARLGQETHFDRETAPGLFLPDHPVFASLARDLEPF